MKSRRILVAVKTQLSPGCQARSGMVTPEGETTVIVVLPLFGNSYELTPFERTDSDENDLKHEKLRDLPPANIVFGGGAGMSF